MVQYTLVFKIKITQINSGNFRCSCPNKSSYVLIMYEDKDKDTI